MLEKSTNLSFKTAADSSKTFVNIASVDFRCSAYKIGHCVHVCECMHVNVFKEMTVLQSRQHIALYSSVSSD